MVKWSEQLNWIVWLAFASSKALSVMHGGILVVWRGCYHLALKCTVLLLRQKPYKVLVHRGIETFVTLLAAVLALHCLG